MPNWTRGASGRFWKTSSAGSARIWPLRIWSASSGIYRARYRACPFDESPAFPGIPPLFERLSGRGCRLFVATNKPEDVTRRLLDVRGLLPFLAGFACSDSLPGRRLSKAGMLALLMERHGVEPGTAIMVGDSAL